MKPTQVIPKNPLTMWGTLDRCWLLTYQTPLEEAQKLIPPQLELVTHRGFAFWNVVICHIHKMRPKPLPSIFGLSYWHVAYRLYVRCHPKNHSPIEGLYFLRSDCDHAAIAGAGNYLTDFQFHPCLVDHKSLSPHKTRISIESSEAPARIELSAHSPELPKHSAFSSLKEAGDFLKYKPHGISVNTQGQLSVISITRDETAWKSRLVDVPQAYFEFFRNKTVLPEICYEVEPIRYQWNRGKTY
jgi:hypothetical protein